MSDKSKDPPTKGVRATVDARASICGAGHGIGRGVIGRGTGRRGIGRGTGRGIGRGTGRGVGRGTARGIGRGTGQDSIDDEMALQKIDDLVVYISASMMETTCKLFANGSAEHKAALRVAQDPRVQSLRDSEAFKTHHRCEPNYGLDSGQLACLEKALPCDPLARMKIGFIKVVICPQDGMLSKLEEEYLERTGQSPWEGASSQSQSLRPRELLQSIRQMKLDHAYAGMRRSFFRLEAERQRDLLESIRRKELSAEILPLPLPSEEERNHESGLWQRTLFVNYFVYLCNTNAFEEAFAQFAGQETKVELIFENVLHMKSGFYRMLLAREYSFLFENFPDDAADRVVTVGGVPSKQSGSVLARISIEESITIRKTY